MEKKAEISLGSPRILNWDQGGRVQRDLRLVEARISYHVRPAVGHGLQEAGGSLALSEQERDKLLLEIRVGDDLEDTSTL